jgi:hypothetical protein
MHERTPQETRDMHARNARVVSNTLKTSSVTNIFIHIHIYALEYSGESARIRTADLYTGKQNQCTHTDCALPLLWPFDSHYCHCQLRACMDGLFTT